MQIVIDIPQIVYESIKDNHDGRSNYIYTAIKNGIVLPEKHGDLIDRDTLRKSDLAPESWYSPMWGYSEYEVEDADIIIEASEVRE